MAMKPGREKLTNTAPHPPVGAGHAREGERSTPKIKGYVHVNC